MSLRTIRNSLPLWCIDYKKYEYDPIAWHEHWRDDFDDGVLAYEWSTHALNVNKTIDEDPDNETLTIAITNNEMARWWWDFDNLAPKMYMPLGILGPCRITTKLNKMDGDPPNAINHCTSAGIFIGTYPEGKSGTIPYVYKWMRYSGKAGLNAGILVQSNIDHWDKEPGMTHPYCPLWLRLNITETGTIHFEYSQDGVNFFEYSILAGVTNYNIGASFVGLFALNRASATCVFPWANCSAEFEYFLIEVKEARRPTEKKCYAPIDVRSPDTFYDGRIQSMATLKRAIDDKTGLFQVADMSLTLKNTDKHFSSKMANRILKDQEAVLYHAWTDEPEDNKSHMITMVVDDYSIKGPDFFVKLKDISQKYFIQQVPADICTEDDYPLISDDHKGRCKPEVLGLASIPTGYEHEGAVEAVYVHTGDGKFIAANHPLRDITEVFLDNGAPGAYSWYVADGDTYIDFTAPPATTSVVSFNAQGYFRDAWDSALGYIQNPAYIMLFYLRFIMGIPASLIDFPAFATLAQYYIDIGEEQSFYLILQYREDAMEVLRQMLFSAGAKAWINLDGKFTIARKDVDDWEIESTDYHLFEQTDLIGSPHRKWNMTSAINTINIQYGYIPWQNLYTGARSEYRENPYDRRMEDERRDRKPRRE